jgi:outer membrane protein OmpA-like peptidoglycan-associated protein
VALDERSSKLYFLGDVTTLRDVSRPHIVEIARILRENPSVRVRITGFINADRLPSLDRRRAEEVKELLAAQGVEEERMEAIGGGVSTAFPANVYETAVDADGSEYRYNRNMRVEIKLVDP